MPGRDRTGPAGTGPMTGRGFGWCGTARPAGVFAGGFGAPGFCGGGRGRGRGNRYYETGFAGWGPMGNPRWPAGRLDEVGYLRERARNLEEELSTIRARVADLEKEKSQT